jgi:hypothetical protein
MWPAAGVEMALLEGAGVPSWKRRWSLRRTAAASERTQLTALQVCSITDSFASDGLWFGGCEERGAAQRAAGSRPQPRVDAFRVEFVPAPRERLHLVALGEIAQADGAALRCVTARARPVHVHREPCDGGVVEAARRGGGQRRREGGGRRRRPGVPRPVVAVARPAEVQADGDEADEDRHEERDAAPASGEVAIVHVAVSQPRRLLRRHSAPYVALAKLRFRSLSETKSDEKSLHSSASRVALHRVKKRLLGGVPGSGGIGGFLKAF